LRPTLPVVALLCAAASLPAGAARRAVPVRRPAPPVIRLAPSQIQSLVRRSGARATLVNVWATWCDPCREEFPWMLRAARARRADGLRLVLISADFDDRLAQVRRFLRGQGVSDTTYLKTGGDMPFIDALNPRWSGTLPATFVFDPRGRVVQWWEGQADSARFESAIRRALAPNAAQEDSTR